MSIAEKVKKHPLALFWTQLRGAGFAPVDGKEMRSAFLKRFQQIYDELKEAEFPLLSNLSTFLHYLGNEKFQLDLVKLKNNFR